MSVVQVLRTIITSFNCWPKYGKLGELAHLSFLIQNIFDPFNSETLKRHL